MSNIGQIINHNGYSFRSDIGMMTPSQYVHMIHMLESLKPKRICELGSGESTKIYNEYNGRYGGERFSIESDIAYKKDDNTIFMPTVVGRELNLLGHSYPNCMLYEGFEDWLNNEECFDFIFIDGPNDGIPFNDIGLKYCRIQLLDFVLLDKMSDKCTVLYHDSEREIAQNTLMEFERLLKERGYSFDKEVVKETDMEYVRYNERTLGMCPELTVYKITNTIGPRLNNNG